MADVQQIQLEIRRGWHEIGEPLHERGFRLAVATAKTIDIQTHSLACLDDALRDVIQRQLGTPGRDPSLLLSAYQSAALCGIEV